MGIHRILFGHPGRSGVDPDASPPRHPAGRPRSVEDVPLRGQNLPRRSGAGGPTDAWIDEAITYFLI